MVGIAVGRHLVRVEHHQAPVVAAGPGFFEKTVGHHLASGGPGSKDDILCVGIITDHNRIVPDRQPGQPEILQNYDRVTGSDFGKKNGGVIKRIGKFTMPPGG